MTVTVVQTETIPLEDFLDKIRNSGLVAVGTKFNFNIAEKDGISYVRDVTLKTVIEEDGSLLDS